MLSALLVGGGLAWSGDPEFEAPVRLTAEGVPVRVESPGYAAPCWAGIDGDGKGIISFDDKCITLPDCEPDDASVTCEVPYYEPMPCVIDLSKDYVGNTTIFTNEQQIADLFVEEDVNVSVNGSTLTINLLAE